VRHPTYVEALSCFVTIAPGAEAHVHVVMHGGATLEGRVLDDRDRPVAGARIDLAATRGTLERTTTTAEDGTFGFAGVPSEVVISLARPDAVDDVVVRTVVTLKEDERKEIELVLPPLRDAVRFRVVDDHKDPIDAAQITVSSLSRDQPLRRTLFSTRDGTVELKDTAGLALRIEVTAPGKAPLVREVDAATAEIVLELLSGRIVEGTVTTRRGHDALADAEIALYEPTGVRRGRSARDGTFRLTDVSIGSARVVVSHAGYATLERTIPDGRADRPFEIDPIDLAEGGTIEGTVVDERGDPVAGARVAKDAIAAYVPAGRLPPGVVVTDRKGAFRLADMPEGDVTLVASSPDVGRSKPTAAHIVAGRETNDVRIVLVRESSREPSSEGAGGVAVTLGERHDGSDLVVLVVMVASASEAEHAGVLPGDQLISIDGRHPASLEQARDLLSGPLTDDVVVEIERASVRQRLRIPRERVQR
jgi:hypothetical protein